MASSVPSQSDLASGLAGLSIESTKQVSYRLELSPLDKVIAPLYVHKFFGFGFDAAYKDDAIKHIKQRLAVCILRWPFITGRVAPMPHREQNKAKNLMEISYELPVLGDAEGELLTIKILERDVFPHTFASLEARGFPPRVFDMALLSKVPEWPEPDWTYPALAVQANFFEGGLILTFAFHHIVADGGSFMAFIKEFGSAGAPFTTRASDGTTAPVQERFTYVPAPHESVIPLRKTFEYTAPTRFDMHSTTRNGKSNDSPCTTKILQFSAKKVKFLEETVAGCMKQLFGPDAWASNIAILSSLIWVGVIRARIDRLTSFDNARIGVAVNIRSVMQPKLPEDYFGNAIVHTIAECKVAELILSEPKGNKTPGIDSPITTEAIACAAWEMRKAVKHVDDKYVDQRLATLASLEDPAEAGKAYSKALNTRDTGIDFSSWRDQGADVDFAIPGTKQGTLDFWRKAWSPNEGAYNILPRKGGSKGDAVWEISLGLSFKDFEALKKELGGWVDRWVE